MKKRERNKDRKTGKRKDLMVVKVRYAKNGLILEVTDGNSFPEEIVYQEQYGNEVECFADLLRFLDEHLGPTTSRYSEKRIYIRVEPGDKFEDKAV